VANEQGSVAVLGLIAIMLLVVMGSGLLILSNIDLEIAANHRDGISAQYLAEAGIQWAIVQLKIDTNFIIQTGANNVTNTENLDTKTFSGVYQVTTGPDSKTNNQNIRLIRSIGTVNKAKRQTTAQVLLPINKTDPLAIIWGN
jgi:polysaccharide pyruvyl transferase WcaK-like protein